MLIVKDPLTEALLRANIESSEPVYSELEVKFLKQYAQHAFTAKSIDELLQDEDGRLGINQDIFNIVVRVDFGIYRGGDLEREARRKAGRINPLLEPLGIGAVVVDPDPIHTLYQVKIKGLEEIKKTENRNFESALRKRESDEFPEERSELCRIFNDPDLPIFVYGSHFNGNGNGNEIDMAVSPKELTEGMYRRLRGTMDLQRKPELSILIVPRDDVYWFAISDTAAVLTSKSVMINGGLLVPSLNREYMNLLKSHKAASNYRRLRDVLTSGGIESCLDENGRVKIGRVNSYLKAPMFIHQDLTRAMGADLPRQEITQFESLPSRDELVKELTAANLRAYNLLLAYQTSRVKMCFH